MSVKVLGLVLSILCCDLADSSLKTLHNATYDLGDHTMVTKSNVFPYVAAILNKSRYLCAGALIDEYWVLTSAESVLKFRDALRLIHVRLGTINNKKDGILLPIKLIEFHPYFDDQTPEYDIALIRLPERVKTNPSLNPVRLQMKQRKVVATHFIVTSWPTQHASSEEIKAVVSSETVKRRRILQVAHLHPTDSEQCSEELRDMGVSETNLMCLDQGEGTDHCSKDVGAPVVLNGVLWGVVSSWVPEDCDLLPGPTFVTLVAAPNISSWIQATLLGRKWHEKMKFFQYDELDDDFDDD